MSLNAQELLFNNSEETISCTFDDHKLEQLIKDDSLYKATILLNDALTFSKKFKIKSTEAQTYNALGVVSAKMSSYKNAETYHLMALDLYKSINSRKGKDRVLSSLLKTYLLERNYSKFDSLFPNAQKLSSELNSESYYVNLEHKIIKNYFANENKELLNTAEIGLRKIDSIDFSNLVFSKNYDVDYLKERLKQSYFYHKALALIKLKIGNIDERYNFLFSVNESQLKHAFKSDPDMYRKLGTLNYYKYLYFTEVNKNLDSATKYLLKSDSYKYTAITNYKKRNLRNGKLIYNIINTENELRHSKEIRKNEAKVSKALLFTTILIATFFLVTLIIFYFYIKAKRNIQTINKELKTSNEKLLEIDKDRLEFFSILSHELRTPIYGISGLATLIDQEKDKKKQQSYLDSLISSSGYLSILIDNILQANRLRFGGENLRLKPDKMDKIVGHVISTIEVAAKNKGLKLKAHIDDSDINEYVLVDKVAFSQILINLAYNAIRYTKEGHIAINVLEKSRTNNTITLRFEVKDTGIGIKDEHRSVVFNAFENKAFLTKNSSGSGLGLHIVKTLLESHGSDIDFISKPNEGTCFFFETTFKLTSSPSRQNTMSVLPKRDMRVLVVDDNKINLLITKKNVERIAGYSCKTLSNGREAISVIKEKDFDLILMDINMPDMDGYEATRHIRIFNPHIPILALTALNSAEITKKAESAGINQIITKPYIFEDFKAIITSYNYVSDNYFKCIDAEAI